MRATPFISVLAWLLTAAMLPAATRQSAATQEPGSPAAAVRPSELAWDSNLEAALARAAAEYRPVLLLFTSPDCQWCGRLKAEVLADSSVQAQLLAYLRVEIDASVRPELAFKYEVRGVPAMRILSGDGRVLASASGFLTKEGFGEFLASVSGRKVPAELSALLQQLGGIDFPAAKWPEVMAALGMKEFRPQVREALLKLTPAPRAAWAALLQHPRLAVRLGALEILEEAAGNDFGFDPWADVKSNQLAVSRWAAWAAQDPGATPALYASLTQDATRAYLRELVAGDRDRSLRALRMLEQGGPAVLPELDSFVAAGVGLSPEARLHVREVKYALLLPSRQGGDGPALAHRLVFGSQDARLKALAALTRHGAAALPIYADYLADPDPLIRETAVDSVVAAAGAQALPLVQKLVAVERDTDVLHAVVRNLALVSTRNSLALLTSFLTNANEDLVVAALGSVKKINAKSAASAVGERLADPRWRVRAAALEAAGKLRVPTLAKPVAACLADADPFVRRCAANALADLGAKDMAPRLEQLFLQDDQLKGVVVAAFGRLELKLPASFIPALKGKPAEVLLAVLDGVAHGQADRAGVAGALAQNPDPGVASAAIRLLAVEAGGRPADLRLLTDILAGGGKPQVLAVLQAFSNPRESRTDDEALLEVENVMAMDEAGKASGAVALNDLFSAFDTPPAGAGGTPASPAAKPAAAPGLQDVLAAFDTPEPVTAPATGAVTEGGASAPGTPLAPFLAQVQKRLAPDQEPELRFAAAVLLTRLGRSDGLAFLEAAVGSRPAEDRLSITAALENLPAKTGLPLLQRLLRDAASEVRQAAARTALARSRDPDVLQALLAAVWTPQSPLLPSEVYGWEWMRAFQRVAVRRQAGTALRALLDQPGLASTPQKVLALVMLERVWLDGDEARIERALGDTDPFLRRAAARALGRAKPALFAARLKAVVADPSELVRAVVPALYRRNGRSWTLYFDSNLTAEAVEINYRLSSGPPAPLMAETKAALLTLSRDVAPAVRVEAALTLLSRGVSVDQVALVSSLAELPDPQLAVSQLVLMFTERQLKIDQARALFDFVVANSRDSRVAEELQRRAGNKAPPADAPAGPAAGRAVLPRATAARADGPASAAGESPSPEGTDTASVPDKRRLPLLFFMNPGCQDCVRVEKLLTALAEEFPGLTVETLSIRQAAAMRVNEVLCEHFAVPETQRLTAPAVFCGAGVLVKQDITYSRLGELLTRPEAAETQWRVIPEANLAQADAQITQRYSAMGLGVVVFSGLLDGINPCAFATIIFLLSYLHVTRRRPGEILQVGSAFVAGVFITYLVLGLGLVEVVARLQVLRRFGVVVNGGMAVFALIFALLNLRDGIRCLRGRMAEMTLQLPQALKDGIHATVRRTTRHGHFVIAAGVAGAVISVLELACTGQVYLPTILFMLQAGHGRSTALGYLVLYNVAFVLPLVLVFILAFSGLRSDALGGWLQRHAATVKFSTALLFGAIFLFFVWSSR